MFHPPQSALDREAERAAAFVQHFFPDGNVPEWATRHIEQRRATVATPYRPGLPPEGLVRMHGSWEAYVEGSEHGVVYDFWFEDDGTLTYKLHTEPVADARPVASFDRWGDMALRPWCWTWEAAEEKLTARGVSR